MNLKKSKDHQNEDALQNEVMRRKILMDASLDGMAIINQNHRLIETNESFAQMLGYTLNEMLTLHTWDWERILTEPEVRSKFRNLTHTKIIFETVHRRKDGTVYDAEVTASGAKVDGEPMILTIIRDISGRKQLEREKDTLIDELQTALAEVKVLRGLIPICSQCKKIRDDKGYWTQIESYIRDHSDAEFSHSICSECSDNLYGEYDWYIKLKEDNNE